MFKTNFIFQLWPNPKFCVTWYKDQMRWRLGTSNVIMLFTQATAKMVLFAGSCPFETAWWKGGARMMSHCALKMEKIVQINESISLKFIWMQLNWVSSKPDLQISLLYILIENVQGWCHVKLYHSSRYRSSIAEDRICFDHLRHYRQLNSKGARSWLFLQYQCCKLILHRLKFKKGLSNT